MSRNWRVSVLQAVLLLIIQGFFSPAHGEIFVGLGGGQSFGGKVQNFKTETESGCIPFCIDKAEGYTGSNLDLDDSLTLGVKAGLFFESPGWSWLGFELQYYQRSLKAQRQPWNASGRVPSRLVPSLPFSGQAEMELDSLKTLAFNILFRIPPESLADISLDWIEPYIGLGLSLNHIDLSSMRTFDSSGNLVGVNLHHSSPFGMGYLVSAGLNFKVSAQWKIFTEYKYSMASFPFIFTSMDEFDRGLAGEELDTLLDVADHTLMIGVTFNFGSSIFNPKPASQNVQEGNL